jgi:hypothetical protein
VVVEYEWQVWKWDEWVCAHHTQSQHSKFPPQCHINYTFSQFEQTNIFAVYAHIFVCANHSASAQKVTAAATKWDGRHTMASTQVVGMAEY